MPPPPHTARLQILLFPLILLLGSSHPHYAHRPVFTDDAAISPDTAIPLTEPHID
jgi:hypothetical protein